MSKLTRVRVTHQVASTRAGDQGVTNVLFRDQRGRLERDISGNLIVYTFGPEPTFIRGAVPPEIADNPLLLLDPATERELARTPGARVLMFGGEEAETTPGAGEPLPGAADLDGAPPSPAGADPEQPPADWPAEPAPEPSQARESERERLARRRRELSAMPWPELVDLANSLGFSTHRKKRALLESQLLEIEKPPLEPGQR